MERKKAYQTGYFQKADWLVPPLAPDIEVDAAVIAKRITPDFMRNQPDDWVIRFYTHLGGVRGDNNPFKDRPIIRLEDGKHVVAFERNGSPNAFLPIDEEDDKVVGRLPMVKHALSKHEQACKFLVSLGLTIPDIADLVINNILPRYINPKKLSIKTWQRDFRKILQAFQTDSHAKRNRLKDACKEAYILLAVSVNGNENLDLVKPHQVYLNTSEMREFFSG